MTRDLSQTYMLPSAATIHRVTLRNGITILVYPTPHTRSVVVNGSLMAGAMFEDQQQQGGLASLVAAALMRGTINYDFDTLYGALEDIGADLTISAGMHRVGFSGKALAEDLPTLIGMVAEVLRRPTFPTDQVERLRGERLTALNYLRQDTAWLAGRAFRQMLYPEAHPYHYSTRGSLDSVPGLSINDMQDFHQQFYGPRGLIVGIAGNVTLEDAANLVADLLGDWENIDQPVQPSLPAVSKPLQTEHRMITIPGKTQADIIIGTLGPSRFAADYQAANLGNSILGVFGMMGRIGDVVREREGLAYYAGSRVDGGYGPGAWRISAGVDPANAQRAIDLCLDEIRRFINKPVDEEELDDNRSYFVGRLPLQLESNDGIAAVLHSIEAYRLGLDYLVNYRDMINNITAEDIQRAARHYLDPDRMIISLAGPPTG
ncbi:MAG: M16 family metallopeptidase [Chloroflexota bacterium]